MISAGNGRYLAAHLPVCRYVEIAGDDHAFLFNGRDVLVAEVRALIERTVATNRAVLPVATAMRLTR